MKRLLAATLMALFMVAGAQQGWPCVGKTLQVGVMSGDEEKLMTQMLSILVNERTGTSVKIRGFGSFKDCFSALEKKDIDIIIAFAGQASVEILSHDQAGSSQEAFEYVRKAFNEGFNLVWLKPWGCTDGGRFLQSADGRPLPTQAAPLVRKDTLKEFPALGRLVDKMAGRLDSVTVEGLLKQGATTGMDRVARDYLRSEKLI